MIWVYPVMAQNTGSTGGGAAFDKRQPVMTVQYVICTTGLFPTRGGGTPGTPDLTTPLLGEIKVVAFGTPVPTGFMACQGQTLSIGANSSLFTLLGTTFGGNGTTTFGLPNLQGTTLIGVGQGAGLPTYSLGETVGAEKETLTVNNLPAHTHSTPHGATGSTGSGVAFDNMQPSMAVNFFICSTGQVMMFAGNFAPIGWAPCDGTLYTISSQPVLYDIIHTNYGGDNITTFAVPDLRGRAPVGIGQATGLIASGLGQASGAASNVLTLTEIPSHTHSLPDGSVTGAAGYGGNGGNGFPFDIRQPTLGMQWCICSAGSLQPSSTYPTIGQLILFAGSNIPVGYIQAAGQTESTLPSGGLYSLFYMISTNYGGNGTTTFGLPDLRSRMPVGAGTYNGTYTYSLGTAAGAQTLTLTPSLMPAHVHALPGIIQVQTPSGTILTNGATLAYPDAPKGSFRLDSLVITNIGGMNLAVSNANVSGSDPGDFSFTPPFAGTILAAEGSQSSNLKFAPLAVGTRTAQLSITNADLANNPFILYLTGTGIGAPLLKHPIVTKGAFVLTFTGDPASQYTVLTTTNMSLPLSNWTVAGLATNTSTTNFTFSAAVTTGQARRFYTVRFQ